MCRWLERDPAGYQDGPSLYSYLGRNPMAGTDPYGLWTWGDTWEYFVGDRRGDAERTLRENQRLVERRLQEQVDQGLISTRTRTEQRVAMRRDIDLTLDRLQIIELEQEQQVIETEIQITLSLVPGQALGAILQARLVTPLLRPAVIGKGMLRVQSVFKLLGGRAVIYENLLSRAAFKVSGGVGHATRWIGAGLQFVLGKRGKVLGYQAAKWLEERVLIEANRAWIQWQRFIGRRVIDIGDGGALELGKFYPMELRELRGYDMIKRFCFP
jgi:hypothetical protein